ncbi:hypothetical protein PCASD_04217 [Puccinia coronata f. sp. avenae]|uniref:Uncharacterized protein n=1 Tax=Puccinia coronata f. sp. avenae TaxID=200324 RepID=A0A2N5VEN1_9BASI|nr:hypothetical protein PCASD_04217 [Puccinia coronata f. sp. avenae]
MRPRKAKPLPQGSYGQRSPRRVTESLRADHHPIRPEWLASGGTADKRTTTSSEPTTCGYGPVLLRPGDGGKGDGCGDFPSNGGGRRVAANRPHRPCSVAPTIMVTVLPACLGRQGRHVVTSRPHAVSMTEPSQVRRLSSEIVPLCRGNMLPECHPKKAHLRARWIWRRCADGAARVRSARAKPNPLNQPRLPAQEGSGPQ